MELSQKILKQLVQIKSYSGREKKLTDFIMDFCQKNSLPTEKQEGNIIIKFLVGSKKCLIFNAHLDTVKEGKKSSWTYPPFGKKAGIIKDEKIYGLGASDDKVSIAVFLSLAMEFIKNSPLIDIFFTFVTKEEIDGSGSQSFVSHFIDNYAKSYNDVSVIIGEPTNCNSIEIGHRGNIFVKVKTTGDSGHSSNPGKIKIKSIEKMIKIVSKIKSLEKEIKMFYSDDILGCPTICLTGFSSSKSSVNKIPSECSTTWDIRTTPLLHDKFMNILKKKLGKGVEIEMIGKPGNYGLTEKNSKIVNIFKKIVNDLEIKISPSSNDTAFFTSVGIPAVTFGPGNKESIHKENEYVKLDNLNKSFSIYKNLINNY
ncbi:MAG: Acetylornithine deacetylase [Candidatus Roizmanbacteria bacterium GW2011_GWA2_32_13]|uniref:Acetylornithine deacetylase n=1 Tax=Candidatus Roizmanbacteria bacterium GW2011_GWA2_32_13 TaxID=1618475 RepID=A0A0G0BFT8_9BACT|nr:MAG: Acetylornithine deacetylase [Candidatus Roizmanbacteria bacterium GW2011_GWA2_32_13]